MDSSLDKVGFHCRSMFILNDWDGPCQTFYTGNLRFSHVSGGLFSWHLSNVRDALSYFGPYKSAERIETDLVLTASAFKRYMKVQ